MKFLSSIPIFFLMLLTPLAWPQDPPARVLIIGALEPGGGSEAGNGGDPYSTLFQTEAERAAGILERSEDNTKIIQDEIAQALIAQNLDPKWTQIYADYRNDWIKALQQHRFKPIAVDLPEVIGGIKILKSARYDEKEKIVKLSTSFFQAYHVTQTQAFVIAIHEYGHQIGIRGSLSHQVLDLIGNTLLAFALKQGEKFDQTASPDQALETPLSSKYTFFAHLSQMENCKKTTEKFSGGFQSIGKVPANLSLRCDFDPHLEVIGNAKFELKVPSQTWMHGEKSGIRFLSVTPFRSFRDCNEKIRLLSDRDGFISYRGEGSSLELTCQANAAGRFILEIKAAIFEAPSFSDR